MLLTPTTELEAVNSMLSVIGETPVNSLDDNGVVDAVIARQILAEVSREVQSRGWHWNTDKGFYLNITFPEGFIYLPANTLMVDSVGRYQNIDVVQRGQRLYDRRNHTYQFSRPIQVDIVRLLPFEELPQAARQYIMVRAGRIFQDRIVGSEALNGFNVADENRAWATLRAAETETADYNILSDHYSVGRVLHRW
ncbi:hypothetical protein [Telmatospirillum sp. J64-1]|uniref:hypothetical protein n=1 Tax=Telmatospirillum sp. J64-1 TaxID=2502183 RepID=UPI00163D7403|nr:hypothetical protein [Telmatospirillum sp. J64-1]